jgi:hypothetical protein
MLSEYDQLKQDLAREIRNKIESEVSGLTEDLLWNIQGIVLQNLEEHTVLIPQAKDYESISTDIIRDGLCYLERCTWGTDLLHNILPAAMWRAIVKVLSNVLTDREKSLLYQYNIVQ